MATFQNLVDGALRLVGRLGSGDSPSSTESADYLIVLNEMLDSWSAKLGPIFAETTDSLTWTGAAASMTIGVSGGFNTARPVQILSAWFRRSGTDDYEIKLITHQQYQAIQRKAQASDTPQYLAYNPTFSSSLGTLFVWPVPSSSWTLRLVSLKPLSTVSALSDTVTLPPGFQEAIRYNLAIHFRPENGGEIDPFVIQQAKDTFASLVALYDTIEPCVIDSLAPGQNFNENDIDRTTIL